MAFKITDFKSIKRDDLTPTVNIDMINQFINSTRDSFPPDYDVKVLTFIGAWATGKSTTLNVLSALLKKNGDSDFVNAHKFDRIKRVNHYNNGMMGCTIGLYCKTIIRHEIKKVFVLIDTQGTQMNESAEDPLVILFSYCISDIIMINTNNFTNATFNILEDITLCSQYFDEASKSNKPTILFRLYDAETNNSSELQNMFNTFMQDKMDNVKMTREYTKTFFNLPEFKFVWSGRPSDENIKQIDSDKPNIEKFIRETSNYAKMCQIIFNVLINLPKRNRSFHQELLCIAEYVSNVSSKIRSTSILIYRNLNDEEIKKWLKYSLNSNYQNLFTHSRITDCSDPTLNLITNRSVEIDEFKRELRQRFGNSPDFNILMNNISHSIEDIHMQMKNTFYTHQNLMIKNIYSSIKTEFSIYNINIIEDEWINKDVFDTFINKHTIGLSKDAGALIRKYANDSYYMIAEKFNNYKIFYANTIRSMLAEIKTFIIDKKNKCLDDLKSYAELIHFSFDEVVLLILYSIQRKYNIILDIDSINNAENVMLKYDIKEDKVGRYDKINTVCVEIPRFEIIYDNENKITDLLKLDDDKCQKDFVSFEKYSTDIPKIFNEFKSCFERLKSKFNEMRKKRISYIIDEINTKSIEEKIEYFELIKHNDLCLLNIEPNDKDSYSYQIFKSDKDNLKIMTVDQFSKKFGKNVLKLYKKFQTDDKNVKEFIRSKIYDMICEYQLLE
jgi:hypothetical protein